MSLRQFTFAGITVDVDVDPATPPLTTAQLADILVSQGRASGIHLGHETRVTELGSLFPVRFEARGRRTCPALFGAASCAEPTEEGEGNPEGYCTRHLDLMAGDQEDWETAVEYARRRRQLCPHQTGSGLPWTEWCPEPSDPESEGGFCLVHEPTYNPEAPEYDVEAAQRFLDETVPCLQCRGVQDCEMCAGTGRITLRRANWHRGDDTIPSPYDTDPKDGATETSNQEASDDARSTNGVVQVVEGVVIGHAHCSYKEGCMEPSERVIDPYQRENYGETVEIDICETHLRELCDDI